MKTTMSVTKETLQTWRELADRSGIDLGKIMELIGSDVKTLLAEIETPRVSFVVMRHPRQKIVMIGIIPMEFGSFEMPSSATDKQVDREIRKRLRK